MLYRFFIFRLCDREMIGAGNLVWLAEISRARERLYDLFSEKLRQDDKFVLDQLLSLDPKRRTLFQIEELFVEIHQPVIVTHKTQGVGLRVPKELS
jgi:hypothetical protein